MIQRVQSIYLVLVAVLSFSAMFCPLATFVDGTQDIAVLNNWYFSSLVPQLKSAESLAPLALGALLAVIGLLSLTSLMLFHFRMRQLRLTIFSTILLVGYVAVLALLAFKFSVDIEALGVAGQHISFHAAAIFPVLSVILNILAIHGIRKDEKLVRSLDRIR